MLSRRDLVGRLAAGTTAAFALVVTRTVGASASVGGASRARDAARGNLPLEPNESIASPQVQDQVDAALASGAQTVSSETMTSGPWSLLRPLTRGSMVAHGWRLADLSAVVDGACVLTLENQRGRSHRVHLCKNDGRPQGLVYTECLDLIVMNGGGGDLPTEEGLAQAVAEIAHLVAANEKDRHQQPLVVTLQPHAQRLRLYAVGEDARLR